MANNGTFDSLAIVRMLLDNLTESLTQMVVKYESLSRDTQRIEQNMATVAGQSRDAAKALESVSEIRTRLEQNTASLQSILDSLEQIECGIADMEAKASDSQASQKQKLADIAAMIESASKTSNIIKTEQDNLIAMLKPVSKLSSILSTPAGVAIFIAGLLAIFFAAYDITARIHDYVFRDRAPAAQVAAPTNTVPVPQGPVNPTPVGSRGP